MYDLPVLGILSFLFVWFQFFFGVGGDWVVFGGYLVAVCCVGGYYRGRHLLFVGFIERILMYV